MTDRTPIKATALAPPRPPNMAGQLRFGKAGGF
ncbi:hypothetical protein M2315_000895 [Agrobacterium fabrum]|nr:hypothetical protein [Agrobacterium fabrum]